MSTNKKRKKITTVRTNSATKNIACLESLWDDDPEKPITVAPLLDVIEKRWDVRVIHLTCNTKEELNFCLKKLPVRNYRILYLALHGARGTVALGDESTIDLTELSALMGTRFKNWIIFFGSCYTMNASDRQLKQFLESTQSAALVGYGGSIDWVESAAMDLIVLDWLEYFKSIGAFQNRLRKDYHGLVRLTDLKIKQRQSS